MDWIHMGNDNKSTEWCMLFNLKRCTSSAVDFFMSASFGIFQSVSRFDTQIG